MGWRSEHGISRDFRPRPGGGRNGYQRGGRFGERLSIPDDFQVIEQLARVGS